MTTWDATQSQGPEEPWGECRLASAGTWRGKAAACGGQTSPPSPTGLFPEASETALGWRGHLWAQTQREAISEELPGHLTPAVYERAHLGPSWLVSPPVGCVCPHLPPVRHTHTLPVPVLRAPAALFPRVSVVHALHLVASREETGEGRGGDGSQGHASGSQGSGSHQPGPSGSLRSQKSLAE